MTLMSLTFTTKFEHFDFVFVFDLSESKIERLRLY